MSEPSAIKQYGRYRVIDMLGRGSMSTVYRALDPMLGREVAVKVVHPSLCLQPGMIKRFEREAMALARLDHPHVIRIFDMGQESGVFYMVIRLLPGGTLKDHMKSYQNKGQLMPFADSCAVMHTIAGAVDFIHHAGFIHRDLKPSNIMFDEHNLPILADFGIVKSQDSESLTVQGGILGTPYYMSPEQCLGEPLDHRSDVYSLGVILYEMCTGRLPFSGKVFFDIVNAHAMNQPPAPAEGYNPNIPAPLLAVIRRSLARKLAERFQTAQDLGEACLALYPPVRRDTVKVSTDTMAGMSWPDQPVAHPPQVYLRSLASGVSYRLKSGRENRIGRSKTGAPVEVDLASESGHEYVHSWHATIRCTPAPDGQVWELEAPANIINPIYINSTQLAAGEKAHLKDGDVITFTVVKLVVEFSKS